MRRLFVTGFLKNLPLEEREPGCFCLIMMRSLGGLGSKAFVMEEVAETILLVRECL